MKIQLSQRPRGPWSKRVRFSASKPFAFRPNQIVCIGGRTIEAIEALLEERKLGGDRDYEPIFGDNRLLNTSDDIDVEEIVAELRSRGFRAEPNYVFFLHTGACGCPAMPCGGCGQGGGLNPFTPNPFTPNPFTPNPFTPNPFTPNPFTPNGVCVNPFTPNPFTPNPFTPNPFTPNNFAASGVRSSSALPAKPPQTASVVLPEQDKDDMVQVYIYDTGVSVNAHLPTLLSDQDLHKNADPADRDEPDELGDDLLDPVAGHGSFIAGIFEQLVPGRAVRVSGIFSTFGDTDVAMITARMESDLAGLDAHTSLRTIVNMSFGAYADQEMYLLAEAVRKAQDKGVTFVASAGNDSLPWPSFPAALPGVVGVGSFDECGRAPYSNYGSWVRACAPGTAVVSSFYHSFNGKTDPVAGVDPVDPDKFDGWAEWTGTSFAAPIVAAALARHMVLHQTTGGAAVEALIDNPALHRFPGLGTVVNLTPGM